VNLSGRDGAVENWDKLTIREAAGGDTIAPIHKPRETFGAPIHPVDPDS
jgi:hypothetical protein